MPLHDPTTTTQSAHSNLALSYRVELHNPKLTFIFSKSNVRTKLFSPDTALFFKHQTGAISHKPINAKRMVGPRRGGVELTEYTINKLKIITVAGLTALFINWISTAPLAIRGGPRYLC